MRAYNCVPTFPLLLTQLYVATAVAYRMDTAKKRTIAFAISVGWGIPAPSLPAMTNARSMEAARVNPIRAYALILVPGLVVTALSPYVTTV